MSSRTIVVLVVMGNIVLFAAGFICGLAADRLWLHPAALEQSSTQVTPPDERRRHPGSERRHRRLERRLFELEEELGLDQEQLSFIRTAMVELRAEIHRLHERMDPEIKQVVTRTQQKVEKVLTPEQAARYREITAEWQKQRERRKRFKLERELKHGDGSTGPATEPPAPDPQP